MFRKVHINMKKFHNPTNPVHASGHSVSDYDIEDSTVNSTRNSQPLFDKNNDPIFRHGKHGRRRSRQRSFTRHSHGLIESVDVFQALHGTQNEDLCAFDNLLVESRTVIISTKQIKSADIGTVIKKPGYEITNGKGQRIGYLISDMELNWFDTICCGYRAAENDPMSFYIAAPNGKELMAIYGLDEEVATEETVQITRLMHPFGTIMYGYLGIQKADAISRATTNIGRGKTFMVPTSVSDPSGSLLYIFRSGPLTDVCQTELLTADGLAITVAEIVLEDVVLKKPEVNAPAIDGMETHHKPGSRGQKTKVFSVNFVEEMTPEEKSLVLGITVTIFNRWLTKKTKDSCTIT